MKPIIGILTRSGLGDCNNIIQYCNESTRRAIIKSGGFPLMITPPQDIDYFTTKNIDFPSLTGSEKEMILYQLDKLDGLFIPGGDKITKYDYYVFEECLKKGIPILGVCLGMQLIANYNINNFKLIDVENKDLHYNDDYKKKAHKVNIKKESKLYKIINKEEITVNSHHLKQIDYTTKCNVIGKSPDNVIEAVELKDYDFCLGVQWHPEIDIEENTDSKMILEYFLEKAKEHQQSKIKTTN